MSERTLAKELCDKGFTSGFAEVRRLVYAGAIKVNGKTATLWNMNVEPDDVITVGRHKWMVVKAMHSDSDAPKRCPFCGGEASRIAAHQRDDGMYYPAMCGCRECRIWRCGDSDYGHGGFATEDDFEASMDQAVAKWNTRAFANGTDDMRIIGWDADNAYGEMIRPRLLKVKEGSPTQAIRDWSVLAHSVMELTGPAPFGEDGKVQLWLHDKSLAMLLDMCDAVDEKFAALEDGDYEKMYRELTDAVNELQKKQPYCYDPDNPVETLQTVGRFIDELCDAVDEKFAALDGGKLTAEQVREVIERYSSWVIGNNRCFHDGAYEAIADELNATLGGEAMSTLVSQADVQVEGMTTAVEAMFEAEMEFGYWRCSECGCENFEGGEATSMLREQNKELREAARNIQGKLTAEQVHKAVNAHRNITDNRFYCNWQAIADELNAALVGEVNGETSDGYHTFNELYHHRAVLFSVVVAANSNRAWKSKSHHDGTMYDGMFIVGVDTPQGQATYHYDVEPYWDMFWCKELERAPEWDGHTPEQAIERIGSLRDVVFKGPRGRR